MKQRIRYGGLPGATLLGLLKKRTVAGDWWKGSSQNVYYTHKGRCGLGFLCKRWNLAAGDEVLAPAYNCGTEIDPFVHYGCTVAFYRIDQNAVIDLSDLIRRVTPRTKAIYVTHYFGWPQDLALLKEFCREKHIYLIEDCALSLFSDPKDCPMGHFGDAVIYSLPKTLPVPDGGALAIKEQLHEDLFTEKPPSSAIGKKMLSLLKRAVLRFSDRIGLFPFLPMRLIQSRDDGDAAPITPSGLPEMPKTYYYNHRIENMGPSRITRFILRHIDPVEIVRRHRENFSFLSKTVAPVPLFNPLYADLPDGVCPLYMPVKVESRREVCSRLNAMGIAAMEWWAGFHRGFDWAEFPDARYLKEHVLAIPIHYQLHRKDMDYISACLQSLANFVGGDPQ
ncbi:MAG: aminotransferase class V-fold PLP-dependent enzyme [Sedimentisphaerales bacterium]|nr:aminotransferase class V-fold PLP-dependent enzyme [Sedimentisphaerales bacterium]